MTVSSKFKEDNEENLKGLLKNSLKNVGLIVKNISVRKSMDMKFAAELESTQ
jgi:hypothetical protein